MRYVRCRECGATEVPTFATCPSCGIKTPIEIRQRWWLLGVALGAGAALGLAVGAAALSPRPSGTDTDRLEKEVADLKAARKSDRDRFDQLLEERQQQWKKQQAALEARVLELARQRQASRPAAVVAAAPDDRLRLTQVRCAAAYGSLARLWEPPYLPVSYVRTMEPLAAELEERARQFSVALAAAPAASGAPAPAAITDFLNRLAALRNALAPSRWPRVSVEARANWRESTVEVHAGDLIYLSVQGNWAMTALPPPTEAGPLPAAEPLPLLNAFPVGALLWRVRGHEGSVQAVVPGGASSPVHFEFDGPLEFRINEQNLEDNAGAVEVEILVLPKALVSALEAFGTELTSE